MKITRIQRIRGHRIFRDFIWPNTLPDFATFNLIYGWNGTGKTTLANLFRHLQTKQSLSPTEGEIEFRIDGNSVTGSAIPASSLPQVRVFNRDAVDRNVFELPNQQLPPVYFIGEDSVEKEKRIVLLKNRLHRVEELKATWESRKASAENDFERYCTDQARQIKNLLTVSGGGLYNNYDSRSFKQTAQQLAEINPSVRRLSDDERKRLLATKEGLPKEKVQPPTIQYPDFAAITSNVQKMLTRSVLSSALPELVSDPAVAAWVGQGLALHTGEYAGAKCHFCKQPMPIDRLKHLEAHFNDQFKQFQNDIAELISMVEIAKSRLTNVRPPNKGLLYPHLVPEYEKATKTFSQQTTSVVMYFEALHKALVAKRNEPFKQLVLLDILTGASVADENRSVLMTIFQIIAGAATIMSAKLGQDAYNRIHQLINEHNRHTDNFAKEVNAARKALEEDAVIGALQTYKDKQCAIDDVDRKLSQARHITVGVLIVITTLESAIQQHQKPAKELNQEMASYLGRDELRFEVQKTGYVITRMGEPALNLSESEKTAIAFMYFLKSLEDTGFDIKTGVIVIDDPVSSLDANSIYSAFGFMKARTKNALQLFVLTHNFTLFRQVRYWFSKRLKKEKTQRPAKFYMLTCQYDSGGRRTAFIEPLDPLLRDYESEYQYLFKRVYEVAKNSSGQSTIETYYSLPNIARRLLEAFLAFRFPSHVADEIRQKLDLIQFDEAKKAKILRFLHTHSHFDQIGDPEHDPSVLSETPVILGDLLDLMKTSDGIHYNGMVELIGARSGNDSGTQ